MSLDVARVILATLPPAAGILWRYYHRNREVTVERKVFFALNWIAIVGQVSLLVLR